IHSAHPRARRRSAARAPATHADLARRTGAASRASSRARAPGRRAGRRLRELSAPDRSRLERPGRSRGRAQALEALRRTWLPDPEIRSGRMSDMAAAPPVLPTLTEVVDMTPPAPPAPPSPSEDALRKAILPDIQHQA